MDTADPALPLEPLLVRLAAVGSIGPDVGGGVVVRYNVPEHPAVKSGRVGDLALADEAEGSADRDAALVAEARNRDVDPRLAVSRGLRLGALQRPARVRILLRCPSGFVGPDSSGCLALLDRILLGLDVALLGSGHQRRVDDLPAHREIAALLELAVEIGKQRVQRADFGQLLTKQPDRIGIRRCRAKVEAEEAQPTQPVPDQIFHPRIADIILCRQNQHLSIATGSWGGRPPFDPSP